MSYEINQCWCRFHIVFTDLSALVIAAVRGAAAASDEALVSESI
jgi:hypothetical protein